MEYLIIVGQKFRIEWYFNENGRSDAKDYYGALSKQDRAKVMALFVRMAEIGEIKDLTKFRSEGDKVFAFKPQPHRFLCFFVQGKRIIVTNAFTKKQDRIPPNEKLRSLGRMKDYENRQKKGTYYTDDI